VSEEPANVSWGRRNRVSVDCERALVEWQVALGNVGLALRQPAIMARKVAKGHWCTPIFPDLILRARSTKWLIRHTSSWCC